MSVYQLSKADILDAIALAPATPRLTLFREALERHPSSAYTAAKEPASLLARTLAPRYRFAREREKTLEGDSELLEKLSNLDSELVTGVDIDEGNIYMLLVLTASPLVPVDVVVYRRDHP